MNNDLSWKWWQIFFLAFILGVSKGLWSLKFHYDEISNENTALKTQLKSCRLKSEINENFRDIFKK